ncbi:hypothetical protein ACK3TF_000987 [Chlorella vulgaris]
MTSSRERRRSLHQGTSRRRSSRNLGQPTIAMKHSQPRVISLRQACSRARRRCKKAGRSRASSCSRQDRQTVVVEAWMLRSRPRVSFEQWTPRVLFCKLLGVVRGERLLSSVQSPHPFTTPSAQVQTIY